MNLLNHLLLAEAIEKILAAKRQNLISDYLLSDKSALIFQAMPESTHAPNLLDSEVKKALSDGVTGHSNAYWEGFNTEGQGTQRVFEGIAARKSCTSKWVSEFHSDGHLLAAVWSFPSAPVHNREREHMAKFYEESFLDFATIAKKVYTASKYDVSPDSALRLTCTLHNACCLPAVTRYSVERVNRTHLRWPNLVAQNLEELSSALEVMSIQLMSAYGRPA